MARLLTQVKSFLASGKGEEDEVDIPVFGKDKEDEGVAIPVNSSE